MSDPPKQPPYFYPTLHSDDPPPPTPTPPKPPDARLSRGILLFSAVVVASAVVVFLYFIFSLFASPSSALSTVDARATAEIQTFATAQVYRQATRGSANATNTAIKEAASTAQAEESATAVAYAYSTATAATLATVEAPPTLTAQAQQHQQDEAHAQATVQALDASATLVFGPSNGSLAHNPNSTPSCNDTGIQSRNFAVEARFYNPYSPSEHGWDYGFAFTNPGDEDESQFEIAFDSDSYLSMRLAASGFYIQDQNEAFDPINLSADGSNLLKIYVLGDIVHVYANNIYEDSLDLTNVNFGNSIHGSHDIQICTGLKDDDMQPNASTRFEDLRVWSLP